MSDHRHQKRIKIMQDLFACTFSEQNLQNSLADKEAESTVYRIIEELESIDAEIQKVAPERPLDEINRVDLAIMRVIVFESRHKDTPKKVLVNEAVEMAKEFGGESSSRFINGALATLLIPEGSEEQVQPSSEVPETEADIEEEK